MTMMALTRRRHRGLHLSVLAIGLLLVATAALGLAGPRDAARAIASPTVFTVVQSPGSGTVQPEDTVTYAIDFTPSAAATFLYIDGSLGSNLRVASVSNPACSGVGTSSFSCNLGSLGSGSAIAPITVQARVNNVPDGTGIDLPASAFVAKDGLADPGVNPAADNAGSLTVQNEVLAATISASLPDIFEASLVSFPVSVTNTGSASAGALTVSVNVSGGVVNNVVCPGATPGTGSGTATASCTGVSAPAAGMTVTAKANDAGAATLGASVTVTPAAGNNPGVPASLFFTAPPAASVNVHELAITGPSSLSTGATATVCTTNNPANPALLAGYSSSANPLALPDYQLSASGGASVSGATIATTCPLGQQGVSFTSSAPGLITVTVLTNAPGTGSSIIGHSNSLAVTFGSAANPVPTLSQLSPNTIAAGSSAFTLTLTGTNFVAGSVARWNSTDLVTTPGTATTLTAAVPASLVLSAGTPSVTVFNPGPGGGPSNALAFTVSAANNPVPAVTQISPNSVPAGSTSFTITVTGTNFATGAIVRWNSTDLVTAPGTATVLTATVPGSAVATAGTANVTVVNPPPGGGPAVTPQLFTISAAASKLAFTTQPGAGTAGVALPAQPAVAVQTAASATVTGDNTTSVTLALTGTGTLTCTGGLSKTVTAGVATFAGCAVSLAGTGFTITATATGLASATSTAFNVSETAPSPSNQVTVGNPQGQPIPRSRLAFAISTGSLDATAVGFIVKRKSDGKYWNSTAGAWQASLVLNTGIKGTGNAWSLAVTGDDRREFAGTLVTLEVRATVGAAVYVNATIPDLAIR